MSETSPSLPTTLVECAVAYVEQYGLSLCLLRPNSKLPLLDEWNAPSRTMMTREAVTTMLARHPRSGIGLVHDLARTFAFDIDHVEAVRALFAEFGWDYDALLAAFPRIRSREGKDKFIARLPEGFYPGSGDIKSKTKLNWPDPTGECDSSGRLKLITVFELRGGENQDVMPPSIHPDTQAPYEWADGQAPWDFDGIPEIPADHPLLILWAQWETFKPQLEAACPWLPTQSRPAPPQPRIYAPGPNQNVIGQFNRAFSVVEILERNGYHKRGKRWLAPHSSTKIPGVCLLEGGKIYSHHGSDILNNGHAHDAFSVFTVLEHGDSIEQAVQAAARMLGIEFGEPPVASMDFSAMIRNGLARMNTPEAPDVPTPSRQEPSAPYRFPRHLLRVPGLVGAVADYILETSLFPQPVLALAASLSFCGAIMGRKIRTASDLRTNVYLIGVADSGSGKEHARKAIKRLAVAAGMAKYIGAEKLASDQGVFAMLEAQQSCLALLDEFGRTLRVLNNDRAPAHLQQLMTILMELSGSADSYIIEKRRAEHTNGNDPRVIVNPNLCIYATTVPGRLFQGLTPDEIVDGFLPRWLIFESDTPDPEMQSPAAREPEADLIALIAAWNDAPTNVTDPGNLANTNRQAPVSPRLIPIEPSAQAIFDQAAVRWRARKQQTRGSGLDALWARALEQSQRLGLIVGGGHQGVIDRAIAQWACECVEFLLSRAAQQAIANVATNEYESSVQKVQAFIRDQGETSLRELSRRFRWLKQKERDAIISALGDAQLIEVEIIKGNNRPTVNLRWCAGEADGAFVPPLSQENGTTEPA